MPKAGSHFPVERSFSRPRVKAACPHKRGLQTGAGAFVPGCHKSLDLSSVAADKGVLGIPSFAPVPFPRLARPPVIKK